MTSTNQTTYGEDHQDTNAHEVYDHQSGEFVRVGDARILGTPRSRAAADERTRAGNTPAEEPEELADGLCPNCNREVAEKEEEIPAGGDRNI